MSEVKTLLAEFWMCRANQRIEDCLVLGARVREAMLHQPCVELMDEIDLMEVSLSRARNQLPDAKQRILKIEQRLLSENKIFTSRFLFERGVNSFAEQDYAKAIDDFLLVSSRDKREADVVLLAFARLNALLCSEYLSLPVANLVRSLVTLMDQPVVREIPGLVRQYDAYRIRQLWQGGELDQLAAISATEWDQATYHLLYLKQLPQISSAFCSDLSLEQVLEADANPYLRSYRLRTLTGYAHPEDLRVSKFSDVVDRIYLWTWLWLTSPSFDVSKLLDLLETCSERLLAQPSTKQTVAMLTLSLDWLILFEPALETRLRPLRLAVEHLRRSQSHAGFFEFEELLLASLKGRLDGVTDSDASALLSRHPLWNSKSHVFRSLFESPDQQHPLSYLLRRCDQRLETTRRAIQHDVVVHLDSMEIERGDSSSRFQSTPACLALELLKTRGSVSCAEFLLVVFQQRGFDAHFHESKISNLLARLRMILPPELRIQKRGDHVQAQGPWHEVVVTGTLLPLATLRTSSPIPAAKRRAHQILSGVNELAKIRELTGKDFSRKDIEATLEKPRATVNRLLNRWIEEGRVVAQGTGRATKYRLNQTGRRA